jgi:hypothetical protein
MFLRTVLVTAVAAGAVTTGFAITAQDDSRDKAPHVGLSDARMASVSQVSPAEPGELLPGKPPNSLRPSPASPNPSNYAKSHRLRPKPNAAWF